MLCSRWRSSILGDSFSSPDTLEQVSCIFVAYTELYCYLRVSVLPGNFLRTRRHRYFLLYVDQSLPRKSASSSCDVTDKLIIAVTSTYHVSRAKAYQAHSPRIFRRRMQGEEPGNKASTLAWILVSSKQTSRFMVATKPIYTRLLKPQSGLEVSTLATSLAHESSLTICASVAVGLD